MSVTLGKSGDAKTDTELAKTLARVLNTSGGESKRRDVPIQKSSGGGGRRRTDTDGKRSNGSKRGHGNSRRGPNRKKGGRQNGFGRRSGHRRNRNGFSEGSGVKVIRRIPSDSADTRSDPRSPKGTRERPVRRRLPPMVPPAVRVRRESGLADIKRTKEARRAARAAAQSPNSSGVTSPTMSRVNDGFVKSPKRTARSRVAAAASRDKVIAEFEEARGQIMEKGKKRTTAPAKPVEVKRGVFLETDVGLKSPTPVAGLKSPAPASDPKAESKGPSVKVCDLSHFEDIENGLVFVCTSDTEKEVFSKRLFGLPLHYMQMMRQINPSRTALFLARHDPNERLQTRKTVVYGVFQASGPAGLHDVTAFGGRFPAQVPFKDLFRFPKPLPERVLVEKIFHCNFRSRILEKEDTHALIAEFYNSLMNPLTTKLMEAHSRAKPESILFPGSPSSITTTSLLEKNRSDNSLEDWLMKQVQSNSPMKPDQQTERPEKQPGVKIPLLSEMRSPSTSKASSRLSSRAGSPDHSGSAADSAMGSSVEKKSACSPSGSTTSVEAQEDRDKDTTPSTKNDDMATSDSGKSSSSGEATSGLLPLQKPKNALSQPTAHPVYPSTLPALPDGEGSDEDGNAAKERDRRNMLMRHLQHLILRRETFEQSINASRRNYNNRLRRQQQTRTGNNDAKQQFQPQRRPKPLQTTSQRLKAHRRNANAHNLPSPNLYQETEAYAAARAILTGKFPPPRPQKNRNRGGRPIQTSENRPHHHTQLQGQDGPGGPGYHTNPSHSNRGPNPDPRFRGQPPRGLARPPPPMARQKRCHPPPMDGHPRGPQPAGSRKQAIPSSAPGYGHRLPRHPTPPPGHPRLPHHPQPPPGHHNHPQRPRHSQHNSYPARYDDHPHQRLESPPPSQRRFLEMMVNSPESNLHPRARPPPGHPYPRQPSRSTHAALLTPPGYGPPSNPPASRDQPPRKPANPLERDDPLPLHPPPMRKKEPGRTLFKNSIFTGPPNERDIWAWPQPKSNPPPKLPASLSSHKTTEDALFEASLYDPVICMGSVVDNGNSLHDERQSLYKLSPRCHQPLTGLETSEFGLPAGFPKFSLEDLSSRPTTETNLTPTSPSEMSAPNPIGKPLPPIGQPLKSPTPPPNLPLKSAYGRPRRHSTLDLAVPPHLRIPLDEDEPPATKSNKQTPNTSQHQDVSLLGFTGGRKMSIETDPDCPASPIAFSPHSFDMFMPDKWAVKQQ